jgi:hypothetical protein
VEIKDDISIRHVLLEKLGYDNRTIYNPDMLERDVEVVFDLNYFTIEIVPKWKNKHSNIGVGGVFFHALKSFFQEEWRLHDDLIRHQIMAMDWDGDKGIVDGNRCGWKWKDESTKRLVIHTTYPEYGSLAVKESRKYGSQRPEWASENYPYAHFF